MSLAIWLTLAACTIASISDVRSRRIPNWLTGSLVLAALVLHAFNGLKPLGVSLLVMAVITIAGTLAYARGGIGGGDIKLAIAGSGMVSYPLCVPFLIYTAIGGGLLALLFLLLNGKARVSFSQVVMNTAGGMQGAPAQCATLPYALAFEFGVIMVALSQSVAPFLRISI
jgi:prepilin peptidase CpaA